MTASGTPSSIESETAPCKTTTQTVHASTQSAAATPTSCLRRDPVTGELVSVALSAIANVGVNVLDLVDLNTGLCLDVGVNALGRRSGNVARDSARSHGLLGGLLPGLLGGGGPHRDAAASFSDPTKRDAGIVVGTHGLSCTYRDHDGKVVQVHLDNVQVTADILGLIHIGVLACVDVEV